MRSTAAAVELWVQPAKTGTRPADAAQVTVDDAEPFGVSEGGGFAGGAAGDEELDALLDLLIDERVQRWLVDGAIRAKGGDQSRSTTEEIHSRLSLEQITC